MTDTSKHIRAGVFDTLEFADTVLISVEINGLLEIENIFRQLSEGASYCDFSTLRFLDAKYHIDIKAYCDTNNIGLRQIDDGKFEWRLTKEKWSQFREKATALYRFGTKGHQSLEIETDVSDDLQVVLSFDEYPISFWEGHFESCNG